MAEARGGGANLQVHGELEVEKTLHAVIDELLSAHQITPAAACLGIAGVDRERDGQTIRHVIRRLGFRERALIVNDALIALVAGGGIGPGLVLVSGTGSIAYGVSPDGVAARAGGWGSALGDEGSAYWIGRRALAAVTREADGRGPATRLTALVLEQMSLSRPQQLIAAIYDGRHDPRAIAELAATVERARSEGDVVGDGDSLAMPPPSWRSPPRRSSRGFRCGTLNFRRFCRAACCVRRRGWRPRSLAASKRWRHEPRCRSSMSNPRVGAVRLALAEVEGRAKVPQYIDTVTATPTRLVTLQRFERPAELASALAADLLSRIHRTSTLVLGLATGRTPDAAVSRASRANRTGACRLVRGSHVQPRRVCRPRPERRPLPRIHAGGAVRPREPASRAHPPSGRARRRPGAGVPPIRAAPSSRLVASTSRFSGWA